jgi:hypothetical protein
VCLCVWGGGGGGGVTSLAHIDIPFFNAPSTVLAAAAAAPPSAPSTPGAVRASSPAVPAPPPPTAPSRVRILSTRPEYDALLQVILAEEVKSKVRVRSSNHHSQTTTDCSTLFYRVLISSTRMSSRVRIPSTICKQRRDFDMQTLFIAAPPRFTCANGNTCFQREQRVLLVSCITMPLFKRTFMPVHNVHTHLRGYKHSGTPRFHRWSRWRSRSAAASCCAR